MERWNLEPSEEVDAVKYPLLIVAVTSTLVVGSLTGASVAVFAAGAPREQTQVLVSAPLSIPADYVPPTPAPSVPAPTGVTVVPVAAPIPTEPKPGSNSGEPTHESSAEPSDPQVSAGSPREQPPASSKTEPGNSGSTSGSENSDSSKSNGKSNGNGNGKGNQSQNGNGKGEGNGGPAR